MFEKIFGKTIAEQLAEASLLPLENLLPVVKPALSFEEYLKDVYPAEGVLDDDLPDGFDNWLGELDAEEWLSHAEDWAKTLK
jgi:hypothetical protein